MRKVYSILALSLLVWLMSGCEKVIDVDPSASKPKVVLVSDVRPDSTLAFKLTYSRFFLDNRAFRNISGATVSLKVNDTLSPYTFSEDNGLYTSAFVPRVGDKLRIEVATPAGEQVEAETVVPDEPSLGDLSAVYVGRYSDGLRYALRFTITDPEGDNYYCLRVRRCDTVVEPYTRYDHDHDTTIVTYDTTVRDNYIEFSCNDYALTSSSGVDIGAVLDGSEASVGEILFFTDRFFSGAEHEVSLNINNYYSGVYDYGDSVSHGTPLSVSFEVELTSFSYDRFMHEQTLAAYNNDIFEGLFSEPVQIYSNIKNGIGIFAGRAKQTIRATVR